MEAPGAMPLVFISHLAAVSTHQGIPVVAVEGREGLCDSRNNQGTTTDLSYRPRYRPSHIDPQKHAL